MIQLTSVESAAGAHSSANVFSEAYIYTRESFGLFLDKLTEKGHGSHVYLGSAAVVDRIFGDGFDGYIQQSNLWGVYPDEKL